MFKVLEYRSQIKALKDEGNQLLTKSETEKRAFSPDEQTRFNALNAEIDSIEKRMDNYIKVNRIPDEALRNVATPRPTPEPQKKGFRMIGEELQAIARFNLGISQDNRLQELRAATGLNEAVPSQGAFLLQNDLIGELVRRTYDTSAVANKCRRVPVGSNANGVKVRTIDETSRANGSRWGGIQVYWEAEADAVTSNTKPKFGMFELNLGKLFGQYYATDELLQDAEQLGSIVTQGFTEEMGFKLSDGVINGSGGATMLGVLNSDALLSVPKDTGQDADTVSSTNILNMWKACMNRANAVWFYNQELEDQLETLTYPIGTGGVMANIFMPPTTPGSSASIKGRPAIAVEQCPGPGDVGDIILMDPSMYWIIEKGGIQVAESIHVAFLTDQSVFRFIYRVNGSPLLKSKITPYKRTSTSFYMSPYVALAAR
jgi:HK97 family phage major capsid protein